MDSRLKKALETEAVVNTAKALGELVPAVKALEQGQTEIKEQLDRIEALLKTPTKGGR